MPGRVSAWVAGGPTLPWSGRCPLQGGRAPRDGGILFAWAQRRITAYLDVRPAAPPPARLWACGAGHRLPLLGMLPIPAPLRLGDLAVRAPLHPPSTRLPVSPCGRTHLPSLWPPPLGRPLPPSPAQAVRTHLPRIQEGGSLASVLDHAMYCGASLGRVGLDFRPLLAPLFEQAVLALYSKVRRGATRRGVPGFATSQPPTLRCTLSARRRWAISAPDAWECLGDQRTQGSCSSSRPGPPAPCHVVGNGSSN